jgi:HAD superfamily hydrolase (TIGR01509 family)
VRKQKRAGTENHEDSMRTDIFHDVQCVLLDIDGTLVDSNDLHVKAWERAFNRYGHAITSDAIREQVGKGGDQLVPALLPDVTSKQSEAIAGAHDEVFQTEYLHQIRPFDRATELVAHLHGRGIKVVLASSSKRLEVDHYIRLLQIEKLIDASTCADDVENSKPAGDLFAAALAKIGSVTPAHARVIGDTPYDVIAAKKCGVETVAVLSGGFPEAVLRSAGARQVYSDVGEILAQSEEWRSEGK